MSVHIQAALAIPGWMSKAELTWLAQQAVKSRLIVELGSFGGRSTRALADNCSGIVIAVDAWEPWQELMTDGGVLNRTQHEATAAYNSFFKHLGNHITTGTVVPLKLDHSKASTVLSMIKPNFLFIDGNHNYWEVVKQIAQWLPKMQHGGIISGHDYNPGTFFGVTEAVDKLLPQRQVVSETEIWWAECP